MSFKLSYIVGTKIIQEWYYPTKALANYKKKDFIQSGRFKLGKFQIKEIK